MATFLEEAMGVLSPDVIGKAASAFGVPGGAVQKAMGAALPAVLGAVAGKAADNGFMGQLFEMISSPANAGAPAESAMGMLESMAGGRTSPLGDMGAKLVGSLFGNSAGGIASTIGRLYGVGGSGSGILGTVGALALSFLGNKVRSGGLNAGSLAAMLTREKSAIMQAVPDPIAGLMAMGGVGKVPYKPAPAAPVKASSAVGPIFGAIILGFIGWLWFQKRTPAPAPAPVVIEAPAPVIPDGLALLKLPNGVELQASPSGIENQLVAFIMDSTKVIDKTTWFDFDRLLFETGSAVLQPTSMAQLQNISEILKAFPAVKLKLGGYTDNVGQAAANMKLSGDRANTAMAELVKLGVAADRLEAEGYGDTVPVADNATEEGRQKNRRTAARVTAK